ncbi:isopenicillin N synthase family dioxygenase [Yoonia sp. R2331]|uniref:isopenicillin N synthase family dioxygenase n=1 Tax=Yoonia sp. R2331 TaxID=3237238 RepID=UPI0034E5944D
MAFPSYDLSRFAADPSSAREVDAICRDTGFLVLTGHGVAPQVIDDVWTAAAAFFAQDPATKAQVRAPYPGYPYGWLGPDSEALAKSKGMDTPPDLKESFNGGPLWVPLDAPADALKFCYQPTLWPDLPGFQDAWTAYYAAMETLAARIMQVFAVALGRDADFFAPFIGNPISALRALHYPATGAAAQKDQQRAGAHTDYGSLTILLPQPDRRGLQVQIAGDWVDVPTPPGAFVINIGDLMALWTNDRWVSTLHRVVAIPDQPARQSLAFFHQPDWDAEIAPLDSTIRERMVRSGPYLMNKFKATGT